MSSFIGLLGGNESIKQKIKQLLPEPGFSCLNGSLFICVDAHPQTTHFQINPDQQTGWVVCGIGITSEENARVLLHSDWQNCFDEGIDPQANLNGHFAIAKWDRNQVQLITDQIGMRNIFIHRTENYTLFSTRLDWMIKLIPNPSLNWSKFGSNWLGINPFSSGCIVIGIDRLAQGGKATISASEYSFSNTRWTPNRNSEMDMNQALKSVSRAVLNTFSETSLGLSGGMDSRVLFATLLAKNSEQWDLYTFDNFGHPDTRVARVLNQPLGKKHNIIPLTLPKPEELIDRFKELSIRSQFSTSLLSLPVQNGYQNLGKKNVFTIDGGFGEIGRRRYLRGIELREKERIVQWNVERLFPYFFEVNADIFIPEITEQMERGFKEDFVHEFEAMPPVKELGIANWLDQFTIRTRGQNLYGTKQGISDSMLFHYMPFIQPSFLNAIFNTPEELRYNATLFRSIIKWNAPELTKVTLVKGDESYPFWMKDILAMGWMKAKQKLGLSFKNKSSVKLMLSMESYTKDLIASQSFRKSGFYELRKVDKLVTDFYDNQNYSRTAQLSWLVSFEVFRKQL